MSLCSVMGSRDDDSGLNLKLRSGVSFLALCAISLATPAMAQTAGTAAPAQGGQEQDEAATDQAEGEEEIVVTGYRESLRSAQDIKRTSEVVVDSVTAEDIGALPDRSVTETLQRIPGVAINRFAAGRDPDHFAVEGSGVVVRGLSYVRSELNGRDTFTANNGRGLSFADVPSELMGGVDVFKTPSADMIEGGIAGTVNLRTRLPFDSEGLVLAGSIEGSYGDFAKEWSPTVSIVASNRWDTPIGEFGILGSFVYSQLFSRADRLQISNYGERTLYSNGDVVATPGATEERTVYLPRGAVMGSQEFDRQRYGYAAAAQWRSPDGSMEARFQFLRSDARQAWSERVIEIATDNVTSNGDSRAVPGTTLEFDDSGLFQSGIITSPNGWRDDQNDPFDDQRTPEFGLQSNNQSRGVDQRNVTTDYGFNFRWAVDERFSLNFDYQHVDSLVEALDAGLWTSTFQDVSIQMNGDEMPDIQFLPIASPGAGTYFAAGHESYVDPYNSFYRSAMDHIEDSEGNEDSFRVDGELDFPDSEWLRSIRVGYRYADRDNTARFSTYNWGVLSEIWGGNGPVWLDDPVDGVPNGANPGAGSPMGGYEEFYFENFMRGNAGDPLNGDGRLFYSGNGAMNYDDYQAYARMINREWRTPPDCTVPNGDWGGLGSRCNLVDGTWYLPGEINEVSEETHATYAMVRFGHDFSGGGRLSGNFGVRYLTTERIASGYQTFNQGNFSETNCTNVPEGQSPTPFCSLPASVREQARAFANGATTLNTARLTYDYLLPSLNLKYEAGGGLQFRFAWYNAIALPEFGYTRNFVNVALSTSLEDIQANGGPVARVPAGGSGSGNPYLLPVESSNFDASVEWYFGDVGQLSLAVFYKRLQNVMSLDTTRRLLTNNGAAFDAIIVTPNNSDEAGEIKGFEVGYQQTYDFLPGFLSGLGLNATYTYVSSSGVPQTTLSETDPDVGSGRQANVDLSLLPLQGLSEHTINITPFYEKGPLSLRLAYSWRSEFLLTTRDVIVPFAPIINEATGQLDGSIFFAITPNVRVGVQAVNLLNEVTRTSQVINDDLLTAPRSWFMNDRRFTGVLRATF